MPKAQVWVAVSLFAVLAGGLVLLAPRWGEDRPPTSPSASGEPDNAAPWSPRRIPKLDIHTHVDPEMAVQARQFLESYGIGRVVNLSGGVPGEGLEDTISAATVTSGFYIVFVNINFEGIGTPGWAAREVKQLERAKEMGARGVKIA
jgi:hypothetical protein